MRPNQSTAEEKAAMQVMRRKVIAMLMAWKPDQFGVFDTGTMRHTVQMNLIYEWVNKYGHRKPKWLNKYSYEELVTLVSQVKIITKK